MERVLYRSPKEKKESNNWVGETSNKYAASGNFWGNCIKTLKELLISLEKAVNYWVSTKLDKKLLGGKYLSYY